MFSRWWSRTPKVLVFAGLLAAAFAVFASRPTATATFAAASTDFYPGPCSKAPTDVVIHYRGGTSGCSDTNGKACQPGEVVEFTATSATYNFAVCDTFTWNFGDGTTATTLWPSVTRQFTGNSSRTVRLSVSNSFAPAGVSGGTVAVPPSATSSCTANANTLCFVNGRYMVTLDAADVPSRSNKTAIGEANVQTPDTGYFTLSGLTGSTQNPEVVVKVLDVSSFAPQLNPPSWVFYGGLTDLEYFVNVMDTTTGLVRQYHKYPGSVQNGFDTGNGQEPKGAVETAANQVCQQTPQVTTTTEAAGACTPSSSQLCLVGGRYKVTLQATNRNPGADNGKQAPGVTVPKNDLFGFYSIPGLTGNPNNLEAFVKILDTRSVFGKDWVFFGTLTNFELNIKVTETATGKSKTYFRAGTSPGNTCGAADTSAFPF